jgi:uncharacterized integral membrane protein
MQFLKTLFWVLLAVFLALLASRNWFDVSLNLWGDVQADIKAPVLLLAMFLLGFVPPFLILRARVWALRRRVEVQDRQVVAPTAPPIAPTPGDEEAIVR